MGRQIVEPISKPYRALAVVRGCLRAIDSPIPHVGRCGDLTRLAKGRNG
jgi:hypothetical protein